MPFVLMPLVAAIVIFPVWAARALAEVVERCEVAGWWAKALLASAVVGVGCVIYRDAVRLEYARVLSDLWREWSGN